MARRTPKPPADVVYDDRPIPLTPASSSRTNGTGAGHQDERSRMITSDDPLTRALAPPPNESASQRAQRLAAAADAKKISDMIDEELARQRAAERKGPKPVKLLLLGESSSR